MLPDQLSGFVALRLDTGARVWIDPFAISSVEELRDDDGQALGVHLGAELFHRVATDQADRLAEALDVAWQTTDDWARHFLRAELGPAEAGWRWQRFTAWLFP